MALVVECCFVMDILDLISHVNAPFIIRLPRLLKYSKFSRCFWFIIFCNGDGCHEILFTLVFSPLISTPWPFPTLISVSAMPCTNISSLTGSISSSAHCTLWVNWLPMLIKFSRIIILWSKSKFTCLVFRCINWVICYAYILRTYNLCHTLLPTCI